MSAKALIEIRDTFKVWIEMREPKRGELAWTVPVEASPEMALDHVICGRDVWSAGEAGFGFRMNFSEADLAFMTEVGMRNIVVHVDYVRTDPQPYNVVAHVKLL